MELLNEIKGEEMKTILNWMTIVLSAFALCFSAFIACKPAVPTGSQAKEVHKYEDLCLHKGGVPVLNEYDRMTNCVFPPSAKEER